jgi:hypothetical protein
MIFIEKIIVVQPVKIFIEPEFLYHIHKNSVLDYAEQLKQPVCIITCTSTRLTAMLKIRVYLSVACGLFLSRSLNQTVHAFLISHAL